MQQEYREFDLRMKKCIRRKGDTWQPFPDNEAFQCGKAILPLKKIWKFKLNHRNNGMSSIGPKNVELRRFNKMEYIGIYF